jgi:chitin disaccharide deacetylase
VRGNAGKELVVTADDFGLSVEVNEAVERAHRDGILTAASLMVAAPAAADAVARARRMPRLGVGLHVALSDSVPLLAPALVPALVDVDGRFPANLVAYGAKLFFNPLSRRQLAAEIAAQFEAFRATGLDLDHVNAHQHFHLHPTVAGAMIRHAQRYGARFVRVPREPAAVLAAIETWRLGLNAALVAPFVSLLAARVRDAGLRAPDHVFGLQWSGAMRRDRLLGLLAHLPPGLSEIYTHPATKGGFPGAAVNACYGEELAALLHPDVAAAVAKSGARLGGFTAFC